MLLQCGKSSKKKPDDFVIATGVQLTVKEFVNLVLKELILIIRGKAKDFHRDVILKVQKTK